MDEQLGFNEPANPVVTQPVDPSIHEPDWQNDGKKDNPQRVLLDDFSRLSPTNYFTVNGENLEIQTDLGGTFALLDLNGSVLYKTRIQKGLTSMKVPAKAKNKLWIATLNGKMMSH